MKTLSSNSDLYEYLCSLAELLTQRGGVALAERIRMAARQATSFSTEFLGEARIALNEVAANKKYLETRELDELRGIVRQLDSVLGS